MAVPVLLAAVLAAGAAVAVANRSAGEDVARTQPVTQPVAETEPADVSLLRGGWDVEVVAVPDADVTAVVGDRDLRLFVDGCGRQRTWDAHPDGNLLIGFDHGEPEPAPGSTGPCPDTWVPGTATTTWVEEVTRFALEGTDSATLLDEDGAVLAELQRTGAPEVPGEEVVVAPLPDGLVPPTLADLQGRWTEGGDQEHWMSFDGRTMSQPAGDGCNTATVSFALSPGGGFLTSSTVEQTAAGCLGAPQDWTLPRPIARVGLDSTTLVLLDAEGAERAQLTRTGEKP